MEFAIRHQKGADGDRTQRTCCGAPVASTIGTAEFYNVTSFCARWLGLEVGAVVSVAACRPPSSTSTFVRVTSPSSLLHPSFREKMSSKESTIIV
ncbi:hypothetical protein ANCCEY_12608 [Ancylostoma ceylanicum]|uniref:Uncharacterized protein n=2 Tax=Ancylostoma ceylanicum TaxID=53326 RepID=A0A0D6L8Z0_9BILA|nr:hypothetical protein ANCCEY_12608 [Ancylostoma ceylanicum]EYC36852.1 hypothetical protein Y032_0850g2679 [Ancylostoma ceylanicum]